MATGPPTVGPKPPLVTLPTRAAVGVLDLGALAGRRPALGLDADQAARGAVARAGAWIDVGAGEAALLRGGACAIDQARPASTGLVVVSMSWP